MSDRLPRRQFLQSASALGLGAGLGPWEALRGITPATADDAKVGPEMVRFRPEIEPVVRWIEETPREQILEKAVAELKAGLSYRVAACGPVPRGHPQHQAAAGRVQVPRGDGDQLRPPAGPDGRGDRAAAPPLLGARQLQVVPGRRRPRGRLGARPGRRVAGAEPAPGAGRLPPGHGGVGRRRGRRRRRRALPRLGGGRDDGADLADGGPRPAQHRPQADLRGPELADLAGDRLGACRARAPLADLRPARPPGRPAPARRPVRGQPGERARRSATTGRSAGSTRGPRRRCSRRSARPAPRPPRPRRRRCSTRASRRARSGTP